MPNRSPWLMCTVIGLLTVSACRRPSGEQAGVPSPATTKPQDPPASLEMGGAKSVTRFFVTSRGIGRGGDLGGVGGADAHCQALAKAEGSGDHTWRAYLSTTATSNGAAVNARDRIGKGPWYNALGDRVATDVSELHSGHAINQENALTERGDSLSPGAEILTGSRPDGTAFPGGEALTCGNWTLSRGGRAQVGTIAQSGKQNAGSWNSSNASRGCAPEDVGGTAGGLLYCFAID